MTQSEIFQILKEYKDEKLTSQEIHVLYTKKYEKHVDKAAINNNLKRLARHGLIWKGINEINKHQNIFWLDDRKL